MSLIKTNPYLKNKKERKLRLRISTLTSTAIERGLTADEKRQLKEANEILHKYK